MPSSTTDEGTCSALIHGYGSLLVRQLGSRCHRRIEARRRDPLPPFTLEGDVHHAMTPPEGDAAILLSQGATRRGSGTVAVVGPRIGLFALYSGMRSGFGAGYCDVGIRLRRTEQRRVRVHVEPSTAMRLVAGCRRLTGPA